MSMPAKQLVRPGMYLRGELDYDAIDAVNFSTLKYLAESARLYHHRLHNPKPSTVGQLKGTASHTAVFEPHKLMTEYALFDARAVLAGYAVFEGGERRGSTEWKKFEAANPGKKLIRRSEFDQALSDRRGSKLWKEFERLHPGKKLIKQDEFDQALRIRDAVRADAASMFHLRKGTAESTLVWTDKRTGILCKARVDWISHEDVIVDLKGTKNAGQWSFGAECHKQLYHAQSAFYADGYETIFPMTNTRSKLLAVEYNEPHDLCLYNLDDETIGIGRDAYHGWLDTLIECRKAGAWPGRSNGVEVTLRLPAYAMPDESDVEALGLEF